METIIFKKAGQKVILSDFQKYEYGDETIKGKGKVESGEEFSWNFFGYGNKKDCIFFSFPVKIYSITKSQKKVGGMSLDGEILNQLEKIKKEIFSEEKKNIDEEIEKSKKEGLKFKITKCNSMIADMGSTEYYPVLKNENMKEIYSEELEKIKPYIKHNIYYSIVDDGVWKIEGKEFKKDEEVSGEEILKLVSKKIEEKENKIKEEKQKIEKILNEMKIIEVDAENKGCDSYHTKKAKIKYQEIVYTTENGWMDNSFGEGNIQDNMIAVRSVAPKPKIPEKYFFEKIRRENDK